MKLYLAGPIANMPSLDAALENFRESAYRLRGRGYNTLNPMDVPPDCGGTCSGFKEREDDVHSRACYLRYDMIAMLHCDGVAMIPGWDNSIGANRERDVARHCGLPVMLEADWIKDVFQWLG